VREEGRGCAAMQVGTPSGSRHAILAGAVRRRCAAVRKQSRIAATVASLMVFIEATCLMRCAQPAFNPVPATPEVEARFSRPACRNPLLAPHRRRRSGVSKYTWPFRIRTPSVAQTRGRSCRPLRRWILWAILRQAPRDRDTRAYMAAGHREQVPLRRCR